MNSNIPGTCFRIPRHEDAESLTRIALAAKAMWGYDDAFMAACRDELAVTNARLDDPDLSYELAEVHGQVTGFSAVENLGPGRFELEALFVDPDQVRRGTGRVLLERAVSRIGVAGGGALVVQSDPHAAAFYRACNALQVGERESASVPGRMLPLFEIRISATR